MTMKKLCSMIHLMPACAAVRASGSLLYHMQLKALTVCDYFGARRHSQQHLLLVENRNC